MLLCWTRWTRWTQGAMEQDQGWLAELQVRPTVVASLGPRTAKDSLFKLSHLHNSCHTQAKKGSTSISRCSPSIVGLLLPASGPPALLVPQRHRTLAPPSPTLTDSLSLSPHLPTISSYHEAAVASCTRSRWLAQVHWKLPRLAPPARSAAATRGGDQPPEPSSPPLPLPLVASFESHQDFSPS